MDSDVQLYYIICQAGNAPSPSEHVHQLRQLLCSSSLPLLLGLSGKAMEVCVCVCIGGGEDEEKLKERLSIVAQFVLIFRQTNKPPLPTRCSSLSF